MMANSNLIEDALEALGWYLKPKKGLMFMSPNGDDGSILVGVTPQFFRIHPKQFQPSKVLGIPVNYYEVPDPDRPTKRKSRATPKPTPQATSGLKIFAYEINFPDRGGGWARPMLIGASDRAQADAVMRQKYSQYRWTFKVSYDMKAGVIGGI